MTLAQLVLPLLLSGAAGGGNEIVLILDNSCSMGVESRDDKGRRYPPNDPERAAVLGTLIVEGLARGSADRVGVLAFGDSERDPPRPAQGADAIRALPYSQGTFFKRPLEEAGNRLRSSALPNRLFLFFTDGVPQDLKDPSEGPRTLGISEAADFETLVIGLFGSDESRQMGEPFLRPLARNPQDLVFVQKPREVIDAFTRGYARVLGSRPETGSLSPGESKTFEVGKYVVEVLVATASAAPGPAYAAKLEGPQGDVPAQASGDNGCPPGVRYGGAPKLCQPPHRHYQVFRAPNSPDQRSRWTLSLPKGSGAIDYGLILRYDLEASLAVPATTRVGETVRLDARMLFRGKTFDDETFFQADGFAAVATIEGQEVPLRHEGGGRFVADWTPSRPSVEGTPTPVQVTFRNAWMEQRARRTMQVEGFLDFALVPDPASLDLGQWRGERSETRRCSTVDLSRSTNADRIPITCTAQGAVEGGLLSCTPVAGSEADLGNGRKGQPLKYEICFVAQGCCGQLAPPGLGVLFSATHPHYAAAAVTVPTLVKVDETGWLRCWWPWLSLAAGMLGFGWVVMGFVRPHDFDPAASVYVAGSEVGLKRASALTLRETPGGTRGFYRNARMCLNAGGDFVRSPRAAVLVLEAGPGGSTRFVTAAGLERKVQRTGKWEPVPAEELSLGYTPNGVYRIGNLYMKWS
ncbi:vWA domain-containing protein [Archangium sp.]|uniref:vWA domain-containing protein n=1 Tax=Archangium sp. TaxID=1872627 RepID=UPI002D57248E|nr:vWA domain-containing protein [Archangium sp.]HYO59649.1 vWA domain-containing protein [Archangium sp.]